MANQEKYVLSIGETERFPVDDDGQRCWTVTLELDSHPKGERTIADSLQATQEAICKECEWYL